MTEVLGIEFTDSAGERRTLRPEELSGPAVTAALAPVSIPVYTVELDGLTVTVIRVDLREQITYQLYVVDDSTWALVGLFGLYVDVLAEIRTWRCYLAQGGTLRAWLADHPEGVRPDA